MATLVSNMLVKYKPTIAESTSNDSDRSTFQVYKNFGRIS